MRFPLTRYTIRCSSVRRRDHAPARTYFSGSGLPMPPNGSRRIASTKSRARSATRRFVSTQYRRASMNPDGRWQAARPDPLASLRIHEARSSARRSSATDLGRAVPHLARFSARRSRWAFRGERSRCADSKRLRSSAAATRATSSPPRRRMMTTSRLVATSLHSAAKFARALV